MDSAVSRILKAKRYAAERDHRVKVHNFEVELHGDNHNHIVSYDRGEWTCDCEEFLLRGVCARHGHGRDSWDSVEPACWQTHIRSFPATLPGIDTPCDCRLIAFPLTVQPAAPVLERAIQYVRTGDGSTIPVALSANRHPPRRRSEAE